MVPVHNMKINIVNKIRDTYLCPPSPRAFAIFLFRDQLARLDEGMDTVLTINFFGGAGASQSSSEASDCLAFLFWACAIETTSGKLS